MSNVSNILTTDRTIHVPVGNGATMTLPRPEWLWFLNWTKEPQRGTQADDRMVAVGVLESYLYLIEECTKEEAWRRIKIMRAALQEHRAAAENERLRAALRAKMHQGGGERA